MIVTDVDKFIAHLRTRIEKLNAENPRSRPLKFSVNQFSESNIGVYLGNNFTVSFSLYLVRNEIFARMAAAETTTLPGSISANTCPKCRHRSHGEWCPNMASDNDCSCTFNSEKIEGGRR